MRVLFAGTPSVAVPSLRRLVADGHDVVAALTREDAPIGRKRHLTPSPVAAAADELGLPVLKFNRIDAAAEQAIAETGADIAAVVAYGGLVPPSALAIPPLGWINLHFSLLPRWRGAAPVQHAVIAGDDITGAVTFQLEAGLDTGPVYGQLTQEIEPGQTSGELLGSLADSGSVLLSQTIAGIGQGRLVAVPQSGEVTHAPKLVLEDGRIDWTQPALVIRRRINGVTPEPGAWTTWREARLKLGPLTRQPDPAELAQLTGHGDLRETAPGRVVVAGERKPRVFVGTGSHVLELEAVQPAGKKMMAASDWARGLGNDEVAFA
ncbi:methionyl-tRNA formyltransferase [Zhihengliuella sp.]|uniref:methionyl-tRNA formyltransferase n=1 Tax=Zhihengliuella sp. TaxID=1954483 RepID=UPI0028121BC5|nr:methionyl-tRNA formyltransferase [Zhihengliuella sp.]